MALLNMLSGFKTYIGAAGLVGLAFYQLTTGQFDLALQSVFTGLTAVGLRHAIAKQAA